MKKNKLKKIACHTRTEEHHFPLPTLIQQPIHNYTQSQDSAYPIQGKVYEFVDVCGGYQLLVAPSLGEFVAAVPSRSEDIAANTSILSVLATS